MPAKIRILILAELDPAWAAQHHKLKHGCYTFEFSCLKIFTTGKIKIEKAHILPLVMSMVSAKYCYVTHKLRLHQKDRCKRFTLF